ncbi:hypothetical protein [Parvularcula dongshanensis]|uniref:Uncharacterized protein n=1 Tax=Parvularcula dongshanensis TaxID=1173995 RepID=A0A840I2H8_9PROT|nr:hypothetical protein [Parvularcula dongshanensis]MBB4658483.1 hypothetical protein [Parvularcula dongshanensis]
MKLALLCLGVGPIWGAVAVSAGFVLFGVSQDLSAGMPLALVFRSLGSMVGAFILAMVGAHIVGGIPAALGGVLLGLFWPRLGWSVWTTLLASAVSGFATAVVFLIVVGGALFAFWAVPICLFSGLMTWRFTLRGKGPKQDASGTAEVFA